MNVFDTVDMIKVELDNIRTFQGKTYEFYRGLNLIVGNNGSGKTTLVSSLYVGLYGRIPSSSLTLRRLVTRGEKRGSIQVTMTDSKNTLVVKREYPSTTEVYLNSVRLSSVEEVFDSEVMKLIYINLLDKVDFTNYVNLDTFYEKMKKYRDNISKQCVNLETELKSIEMVVQSYYQQIEEKKKKLWQVTEEIETTSSVIESLKKSIETIDIDEVVKQFNHLSYILSNFTTIKQKLLDDVRRSFTVQLSELKQKLSEIQSEYTSKVQQLQKTYTDKINQVKNNYSVRIASTNGVITNIETQVSKFSKLLTIPDSKCPVCDSPIDVQHVEKETDKLQKEKEILMNEIKQLVNEMNIKVKQLQDEYTKYTLQLREEYTPIVTKLTADIQNVERQLQQVTVTDDDVATQQGYSSFSEMKEKYLQLQQIVSVVQSIKERENKKQLLVQLEQNIRSDIHNITSSINQLHIKKQRTESNFTSLLEISEIFEKLVDKKKMKQFILSRVVDKINMLASTVTDLPIKLYAFVEDEKVTVMFKNSYGADVHFEELSSGEKVIATIISLFIYRKLLNSLNYTIPKIIVFDELLDRLDYSNAYNVLYFLSKLEDHIIMIVTHREDIMQLAEEIQMNVVKLS